MVEISNISVHGLEQSVIACRHSMRTEMVEYTYDEFQQSLPRAMHLAKLGGGSGHSNFRVGIIVQFDIKYPQYFTPELQRYHFLDIVCSSSKIHRLAQMATKDCFNKYVTKESKEQLQHLVDEYNKDKSYENFMLMLSNCPLGFELFMRCTTNYEQLATIYRQRHKHTLQEDWGAFCAFIKSLPYAQELIICGNYHE